MITGAIKNLGSGSGNIPVVIDSDSATVRDALTSAGISFNEGQAVILNGNQVSLDSPLAGNFSVVLPKQQAGG